MAQRGPLDGRVAIVTGAARGLGRAFSLALSEAGAAVAAADIDLGGARGTAAAITTAGGQALAVAVDVSDEAATHRMADATVERWGRIDILVNNAALYGGLRRKAFGPKMTDPDLRRVHEVEGARIANEILTAVGYDAARREEIVAIIDGHDSRETAMSLNDKVVKDADKLWRFSRTAMEIDHRRFGYELREYFGWLERQIDDWFFTPEATRMARESFTEARAALIG